MRKENKDWHGSCLYSYDNSKEKLHLVEKNQESFIKNLSKWISKKPHWAQDMEEHTLSGGKIKISDCNLRA